MGSTYRLSIPAFDSSCFSSRSDIQTECQKMIQKLKNEPVDHEQGIKDLQGMLEYLHGYAGTFNDDFETALKLVTAFENDLKKNDTINFQKVLQELVSGLKSLSQKLLEVNNLKNAEGIDDSKKSNLIVLEGKIQQALKFLTENQPPSDTQRSFASSNLPEGELTEIDYYICYKALGLAKFNLEEPFCEVQKTFLDLLVIFLDSLD